MFNQKEGLRLMIQIILALLLGALGLAAPAANAFPQGAPKPTAPIANPKAAAPLPIPCCIITAINPALGRVMAKLNATGQMFAFKVDDAAVLKSLRVGQAAWANFKTGQVSVDGRTVCGTIVSNASRPGD